MVASVVQTENSTNPKRRVRNSNFEALRLFAMFLIVLFHFHWDKANIVSTSSPFKNTILAGLVTLFSNWGNVGDALFFMLSSWFLCEEKQSIKKNLYRAWILELQILFYSGCSIAFYYLVLHIPYHGTEWIPALFPFATGSWWYVTSYGLFLLISPFLTIGLKRMGPRLHAILACGLLILYGFTSAAVFSLDMTGSVFIFTYVYILMSYIRWYIPTLLESRKAGTVLIIFGLVLGYTSQWTLAKIVPINWWLFHMRNATSLAISLGLIVLAINRPATHSRIINKLASTTLSIFLLQVSVFGTCYSHFTYSNALGDARGVRLFLLDFLLAIIFFVACVSFDLLRQLFFALTVDKAEGKLFEWIYRNLRSLFYAITHATVTLNKAVQSH
ncbi:acyltransferase family protein [Bombiscardovia apis]|uniref:acyltransferase family protein n=1 Tax=Bombiscardovia apis TaxID=2932182 RepID=UPI0029544F7D|nr:acyltransferase family protein [Bombiscardovia apis]